MHDLPLSLSIEQLQNVLQVQEVILMETRVSCVSREVLISNHLPTVLIGERINPTGKKRLAASLKVGDLEIVRKEAMEQVEAGADILDVNVTSPGVDEKRLLPRAVEEVMRTVDVPLCLDFNDPEALKRALQVYEGKPIINSVTGKEKSLQAVLPLVKEYGAAVVGLTIDLILGRDRFAKRYLKVFRQQKSEGI